MTSGAVATDSQRSLRGVPPRSTPPPITIVLADDHDIVRSVLRVLLGREDDLEVVGDAADAEAALRSVLAHQPTVLVLDLNMPGPLTSLAAIPGVRERSPGTAVVILTMQDDPSFAAHALRAGALGYVLKDSANAELVVAIRRAAAGEQHLAPAVGAAPAVE